MGPPGFKVCLTFLRRRLCIKFEQGARSLPRARLVVGPLTFFSFLWRWLGIRGAVFPMHVFFSMEDPRCWRIQTGLGYTRGIYFRYQTRSVFESERDVAYPIFAISITAPFLHRLLLDNFYRCLMLPLPFLSMIYITAVAMYYRILRCVSTPGYATHR